MADAALDPDLGLLYITVGNPSPDLDGSVRAGDNLFTESIVALDAKSGTRKWHFQEVHHDIWDYDVVSPNVLFDVQMNGKTVKGIGQAGKTGWVYLLDRTNRHTAGRHRRAPGPSHRAAENSGYTALPGGRFIRAPGLHRGHRQLSDGWDLHALQDHPGTDLPGRQRRLGVVAASFNPKTNLMYVCGIHQPQIWTASRIRSRKAPCAWAARS